MNKKQKLALIKSRPARTLFISTLVVSLIAIIIRFAGIGIAIDLAVLPLKFLVWLLILSFLYMGSAELVKKLYLNKYHHWI